MCVFGHWKSKVLLDQRKPRLRPTKTLKVETVRLATLAAYTVMAYMVMALYSYGTIYSYG